MDLLQGIRQQGELLPLRQDDQLGVLLPAGAQGLQGGGNVLLPQVGKDQIRLGREPLLRPAAFQLVVGKVHQGRHHPDHLKNILPDTGKVDMKNAKEHNYLSHPSRDIAARILFYDIF